MEDELFKKVYIKSEADLPPKSALYICHLKEEKVPSLRGDYSRFVVKLDYESIKDFPDTPIIRDYQQKQDQFWMKYIDWYFLPIDSKEYK